MKIYKIWQLPISSDKAFRPYKEGSVDLQERCCVWWDKWDDRQDAISQLEGIFERFNINNPEHFAGHSLSMSDVVEVFDCEEEDPKVKLYYCDFCGWKEVK